MMRALLALFAALPLALLAAPAAAAAGPSATPKAGKDGKRAAKSKPPAPRAPSRPVDIQADSFEVHNGEMRAVWKGHVKVVRDDLDIACDSLSANYDAQREIKKLTCQGNARIRQKALPPQREERVASGDLAVFDNETAVLTVTGSPKAREGANTMSADKVIFDLSEDRLKLEGNVRMVMETEGNPLSGAGGGKEGGR